MLDPLLTVFVFALGAVVGSFLNVVILRYNTGMTIGGRSFCFSCRQLIQWFENIPVLSYLILRGRCSKCKAALSMQYPAIELVTALVFVAVWLAVTANQQLVTGWGDVLTLLGPAVFYFVIFSLLIVIAVYDIRHTIIPNAFAYTFAALSLIALVIKTYLAGGVDLMYWFDLAAGPLLFLPFWALWYFSDGTWMGLGDGKLALGIGWLLGLSEGVSAIVIAFWFGAAYALIAMASQRIASTVKDKKRAQGLTMKSQVPLGPFLVLGAFVTFLFGFDLFQLDVLVPLAFGSPLVIGA